MPTFSSHNVSRGDVLRMIGGAFTGVLAAPLVGRLPARAQLIPGVPQIVFDPANVAAALHLLANDFVKNKETLFQINLMLHQWVLMQQEHRIDILSLWNDISPELGKFEQEMVKNHKLGIATDDILKALEKALPDFNPSDPIHTGLQLYQDYIALSEQTAKQVAAQTMDKLKERDLERTLNRKEALQADSQRTYFQYTYDMSQNVAQGIDLLNGSVGALINATANYYEAQARETKTEDTATRLAIARFAQVVRETPQPQHTLQQYVNGQVQLVPLSYSAGSP
jgi:hypothetical protein